MRRFHLMLTAALVLTPLLAQAAPVTTSPGKTSVSSFESTNLDVNGNVVPLAGEIKKGAAKRILQVSATLSTVDNAFVPAIFLAPVVNGFVMTSAPQIAGTCIMAGTNCTLSAVFWLDLDAAEAAHPGVYIGQPLNIGMFGGSTAFTGGFPYTLTFNATMVKK